MSTLEDGANEFFTDDHRLCDTAWADLEASAGSGNATEANAKWKVFHAKLERHLAMEEEVLFPAIEDATGMNGVGPVAVMLHEHGQMRALLADMKRRAEGGDFEGVLNQGDTLLMLIQQHNAKEEGVLYPMAENVLGEAWSAVQEKLRPYLSKP
jgi:hemerythrin-like domain-containing protein